MSGVKDTELAKKYGGVHERSRRERKKPEFFTCDKEEKRVVEVGKGTGTELKAIANVAYRMSKMKAEDEVVTFLHRVIFKRPGKGSTRKKSVMSFSGFAFPKDTESAQLEKVREKTAQQQVKLLNSVIALFDLPKGLKDKAAKVESIVDFLKNPQALSDVDASQQVKRKRRASQPKTQPARKRKAEDQEEEPAGGPSETKPQRKKRAKKADAPEAAGDDNMVVDEAPQKSPESDDPAPKAEENEADVKKPESAEEGKKEDTDEMDSEEEENNAEKVEDQVAEDDNKKEDPEKESPKEENAAAAAEAGATKNAETNEGEAPTPTPDNDGDKEI